MKLNLDNKEPPDLAKKSVGDRTRHCEIKDYFEDN